MRKLIVSILLLGAVAGCSTYAADRYAVSMDSQAELRQASRLATAKISVGPFTAATPGQNQLECRAAGPIRTPDGESFEDYVREALIDQLQLAELYAPGAPNQISGRLNEINFGSFEGIWFLDLTITDTNGRSFTAHENYDFQASVLGQAACDQTAQALMPAVQNLIHKVVSHPTFLKMVGNGR